MKFDIRIDNNYYLDYDIVSNKKEKLEILFMPDFDIKFEELVKPAVIKDIIKEYNKSVVNKKEKIKCPIANEESILDYIENIYVEDIEGMDKYIDNNPVMNNYNIIVKSDLKLNTRDYNYVINKYKNVKNLNAYIKGNYDYISMDEYQKALAEINKIIEPIKKYDLSPLEIITLAFDLVKDRKYTEEEADESFVKSRDLTKVLTGDKIVCVGFSQIFSAILDEFNITNDIYHCYSKQYSIGHVRNKIYIKDDKYKVNGIYYFDATFDSKTGKRISIDSTRYKHFAMPIDKMLKKDKGAFECDGYDYIPSKCFEDLEKYLETEDLLNLEDDTIKRFKSLCKFANNSDDFEGLFLKKVAAIHYPNMIIKTPSIDNYKKLYQKLKNIYFCKEIPYNTLANLFIKVRKIEYLENPEKYPFDSSIISKMLLSTKGLSSEEIFLAKLFDITEILKQEKNTIRLLYRHNIKLEEQRVELIKVLRRVKDSKE